MASMAVKGLIIVTVRERVNEVAVSSVHSSPLTFMIVTEREAAVRNVHSSPLTFMTLRERVKQQSAVCTVPL